MKVLMIAPTPFFADRGCHVRIAGEALGLRKQGHEIRICTYHIGRDVDNLEIRRIPSVPWYRRLEAGPSHHKYYLDLLLLGTALKLAVRWKPDVIHAHLHEGATLGLVLKALLRKPLIFDYQGSLADELKTHSYVSGGLGMRLFEWVERWVERRSDHVITSTTQAADRLVRLATTHSVTAVLDGVDTDRFAPLPAARRRAVREELGIPDAAVVGIFVGVLTSYQGIDLLLDIAPRALDAAPHLHLLMVGYPHEAYRARVEAAGLSSRIHFTGRVPFERTPELTAGADFALSPKMSRSEGNLKLCNYLACGLPVVAFDTDVNREILGDTGLMVPHGDGFALADAMIELAIHPQTRAALSQQARRRAVEQLSWDRSAATISDIYRSQSRRGRDRRVGAVATGV